MSPCMVTTVHCTRTVMSYSGQSSDLTCIRTTQLSLSVTWYPSAYMLMIPKHTCPKHTRNLKNHLQSILQNCTDDVKHWMTRSWLKLNDHETEFIMFCPKVTLEQVKALSLPVGSCTVDQRHYVASI